MSNVKKILEEKPGHFFLAKIVVNITNPCFLSIVMLAVIIIAQADRFVSLVEWGITLFSLLVLLPGLYVYLRLRFSRNYTNLQYHPMDFLKQHPKDILILGVVCAVLGDIKIPRSPAIVVNHTDYFVSHGNGNCAGESVLPG
jgi:hypothetical protein